MTHLRLWIRVASIVLAIALAACTGTVVSGGSTSGGSTSTPGCTLPDACTVGAGGSGGFGPGTGGEGGGGGTAPGTGGTAPSPPLVPGAIAITAGQLGISHCGSPAPCDPAMLFLQLGAPSPTCADPQPSFDCGSTATYSVSIGIPAAMLQPGTLPLSDPALYTSFEVDGASQSGPDTCPFGGGSFDIGSITLDSVSAASVTFTLSGTFPFGAIQADPGSADGTYVATRCP